MYKKIIIGALLALIVCTLLAQTKATNGTLRIGVESDIDVFTPWDSTNTVRNKILWNIFEPLVVLQEKSTEIKPCLAESWKVSEDNLTWEIKLRDGVKFHDGSFLRTDDVVASFELFQGFSGKVERIDRLTIRITLPESKSGFLSGLAQVKFAIAPAKTIQQYKSLQRAGRLREFIPVGSGPFKLSRWAKDREIVLESFSDYWDGEPSIKNIFYKVIQDNTARISALEKGEIDLIDVLFPNDLPRIKKNPNLRISSIYGMNICYVVMNTTHHPLDNIKIRQALNLAVDKMRLVQMFYYGGYGVPTSRILSPAFWGFTALPHPGNYNPSAATRLLAEAGYDTASTLRFVCIPMARPYLPDPEGVAEEIKKELANVGVNLQITVPPNWTEFQSILSRGNFDLALTGWIAESGDPDYILTALLSGESLKEQVVKNYAGWNDELFDEKLKAARKLPLKDVRGRIKLYNEAQQIFQQQLPWIPLFHTKIFVIHNRKVTNIILYPSSMLSYHKAKIEG